MSRDFSESIRPEKTAEDTIKTQGDEATNKLRDDVRSGDQIKGAADQGIGLLELVPPERREGKLAEFNATVDQLAKLDATKPEDVQAFWKSLGMSDASSMDKVQKANEIFANMDRAAESVSAQLALGVIDEVKKADADLRAAKNEQELLNLVEKMNPAVLKAMMTMDGSELMVQAATNSPDMQRLTRAHSGLAQIVELEMRQN